MARRANSPAEQTYRQPLASWQKLQEDGIRDASNSIRDVKGRRSVREVVSSQVERPADPHYIGILRKARPCQYLAQHENLKLILTLYSTLSRKLSV